MNHVYNDHPIPEAYADSDLNRPCPNCRAGAGDWCRRDNGHPKRTPCLKRFSAPFSRYPTAPPTRRENPLETRSAANGATQRRPPGPSNEQTCQTPPTSHALR